MVCGKQGKHRFYVTYDTFAYQLLRRLFKYMCIIIQNDLHSENIQYTCSNTHVTNVHNYDDSERQASSSTVNKRCNCFETAVAMAKLAQKFKP